MSTELIAAALLAAQTSFKDPVKDATNPHFKSRFVSLKGILDEVRPKLHAQGIVLVQAIDFEASMTFVRTMLLHTSGQSIESRYPVVCAKANDPQAMGSAITYARRYGVASICGIAPADEADDDGESAVETREPVKSKMATKPVTSYDMIEQAISDIQQATTQQQLNGIAQRLRQSKFSETETKDARETWVARQGFLGKPAE